MYKKAAIFFLFAEGRILNTNDLELHGTRHDQPYGNKTDEPISTQEEVITFHEEITKFHRDIFSNKIPFDKKAYLDFWTMARDYVRTFQ